jgi:hypothetical protein
MECGGSTPLWIFSRSKRSNRNHHPAIQSGVEPPHSDNKQPASCNETTPAADAARKPTCCQAHSTPKRPASILHLRQLHAHRDFSVSAEKSVQNYFAFRVF